MLLVVEQILNGLQFGLLLFLLAAGLTLVFGIMDFVKLATWLALHDGRLFRGDLVMWNREFRHRRCCWRSARHFCSVSPSNSWRSALLWPRSSRSCAGDVRAYSVLNDAWRLIWARRVWPCRCRLADGAGPDHPRRVLPAYRLAIIVVSLLVAAFLYVGCDAHPARHA